DGLKATWRALRPHQWAKNLLLFVPLVAAHRVGDPGMVAASLLAFVSFCLVASSAYILNDLLDLGADRVHARKRFRPLASGALSIPAGVLLCVVCLATGAFIAFLLSPAFRL